MSEQFKSKDDYYLSKIRALRARNKKLERIHKKAIDVIHNNTGSGWSNVHLDDALDELSEALNQLNEADKD